MALFTQKLLPGTINQDVAPDKRASNMAYNVVNFETFLTSRGLSFKAAEGTKEVADIGFSYVIGDVSIGDRLFIFTTWNTGSEPKDLSIDAIYELSEDGVILQKRWGFNVNLGFSTQYPINAVASLDTEITVKLYWIDGYNQARVVTIGNGILDEDEAEFSYTTQGTVTITAAKSAIAGAVDAIVEYGYILYNIGGSMSKLSAFTPERQIAIDGNGVDITINIANTNYSYLRLYRIKYEVFKGASTIEIIAEVGIDKNNDTVIITDDGLLTIATVPIEKFLELGSDLLIPKAIVVKKQVMFLANFRTLPFRVNGGSSTNPYYEARAFQFTSAGGAGGGTLEPSEPIPNGYIMTGIISDIHMELAGDYRTSSHIIKETDDTKLYGGNSFELTKLLGPDVSVQVNDSVTGALLDMIPIADTMITGSYAEGVQIELSFIFPVTVPQGPGGSAPSISVTLSTAYKHSAFTIEPTLRIINNGSGRFTITGYNTTPLVTLVDKFGTTHTETRRSGDKIYLFEDILNGDGLLNGSVGQPKVGPITFSPIGTMELYPTTLFLMDDVGVISQFSQTGVPEIHDAINPDTSVYLYQEDGISHGATGPNILVYVNEQAPSDIRMGKMGEVYRIGVVFQDAYGRESEALWVMDLKIPYFAGQPAITGIVNTLPPLAVTYRFVYVERTMANRSVLAQGLLQSNMEYTSVTDVVLGTTSFPYIKRIPMEGASAPRDMAFDVDEDYKDEEDYTVGTGVPYIKQTNNILSCYSPETILYKYDLPATGIKLIGTMLIDKATTVLSILNIEHPNDITRTQSVVKPFLTGNVDESFTGWNNASAISKTVLAGWGDATNERALTAEYFFKATTIRAVSTLPIFTVEESRFLDYDNSAILGSNVLNNHISYDKFNSANATGNKFSNLHTEVASSYVVAFPAMVGVNIRSAESFTTPAEFTDEKGYLPLCELVRDIPSSQYGGRTYYSKSNNKYIISSDTVYVATPVLLQLDTYMGNYKIPFGTGARVHDDPWEHSIFSFVEIQLESTVKPSEFNKKAPSGNTSSSLGPLLAIEVKKYYEYNEIFSQIPSTIVASAFPFNFTEVTYYPTRIVPTDQKKAGELTDAWTNIYMGTYIDLDSQFGPVNVLIRYKNDVIAFQDKGIAIVDIYPKAQTTSSTGQISLGKGSVLDDYRYLKIDSGTLNYHLVHITGDLVFYIDTYNRTLNELTAGDISSLGGFNTLVKTYLDTSIKEDLKNLASMWVFEEEDKSNIHFKISSTLPTLVYNYKSKTFNHSRTYNANYFITFKDTTYGSRYRLIHLFGAGVIGDYMGDRIPGGLEFYLEPIPGIDKVFDAIEVHKHGVSNLDTVLVTSESRTSAVQPIVFKNKFDIFSAFLPRVENSRDRWRSRNIMLALFYSGIEPLSIDWVLIKFSIKKQ